MEELGNEAPYNLKLRDKDIGLDSAEKSCLAKLEKIKAQKAGYHLEKGNKEKGQASTSGPGYPTPATPVAVPKATMLNGPMTINLEEADQSMLPGRKGRRMNPSEELEAEQREEDLSTPTSIAVISP